MRPSLCSSFRSLARQTHKKLGEARVAQHQLREETLTDINILELKHSHPDRIYCQTFTNAEESLNGADWEWWLTDRTRSRWIGFRVQAKVLELNTDTFAHLHYKSRAGRAYQSTRLRKAAEDDGLIPLYCLYTHSPSSSSWTPPLFAEDAYGCALVRAKDIERLRRKGKLNDFESVMPKSVPWHTLVCIESAFSSDGSHLTLPDISASLFGEPNSMPKISQLPDCESDIPANRLYSSVRLQPPPYVSALMEGEPLTGLGKQVRGILVIIGDVINNEPDFLNQEQHTR
ncbi:DUF6615 family protein [Pseudomonas sp. LFM046]|uniref:DUF6615 family protein n=1 Tax=Pseudomonas sp. LFM046 TaxID=1608357 RepID=UPI000A92F91F|nr:DUF6615 family protein [Pseudomonas sp. LFM046]